jgi:hypothetical protein
MAATVRDIKAADFIQKVTNDINIVAATSTTTFIHAILSHALSS